MKRLSEMLKDPGTSGVYFLKELPSAGHIEKLVAEQGLAFFHLEGQYIHDKDQLLKQAAVLLRFPDYFGNNWDALADCLADMSWIEADGFVILYDDFEVLAEQSPLEFRTALDILKESAEFWRNQGKSMLVLLQGEREIVGNIPHALF